MCWQSLKYSLNICNVVYLNNNLDYFMPPKNFKYVHCFFCFFCSVLAHFISPQTQVPSDKGQMQHVPTGHEHMAPYVVIVRYVLIYMCVWY